jgi:hypothetical protein
VNQDEETVEFLVKALERNADRIVRSLDELVTATLAQGLINAGHPQVDVLTTAIVMREQARGDVETGMTARDIAMDYIAKLPGLRAGQRAERERIEAAEVARLAEVRRRNEAKAKKRAGKKGGPGTVTQLHQQEATDGNATNQA